MKINISAIQMGNIAAQLRNKIIRFVKQGLSKRAAHDEYVHSLQGKGKSADSNDLMKKRDSNLTDFEVAQSINAFEQEHLQNAHDEHPMLDCEMDSIRA